MQFIQNGQKPSLVEKSLGFSHLQLTQSMQIESDHALAMRLAKESNQIVGHDPSVKLDTAEEGGFCEIFARPANGLLANEEGVKGPIVVTGVSDQYQNVLSLN